MFEIRGVWDASDKLRTAPPAIIDQKINQSTCRVHVQTIAQKAAVAHLPQQTRLHQNADVDRQGAGFEVEGLVELACRDKIGGAACQQAKDGQTPFVRQGGKCRNSGIFRHLLEPVSCRHPSGGRAFRFRRVRVTLRMGKSL